MTRGKLARLQVCFVSSGGTTSRGGMGRMAQYLTEELRRGHPDIDVTVIDSYGPGRPALMPLYFLKAAAALLARLIFRRPDVVHLNLAAYGSTLRKLLLMRLARLFRVPAILHIHASEFIPFCESLSPFWRKLLVESLRRAGKIIVIGQYWRNYLVDQLGVPAELVAVIYNAVPLRAETVERTTGPRCRILVLGLLGARKGTPELLNALAAPEMRNLDWEAVVAGNGAVEEARTQAAALGLGTRVEIPGWVGRDAVQRLLASADIFVLPSHNEGLPVAILEAMGAGLPVVSTPVGAIPEVVISAENGLLVPPGSVAELATALVRLVADAEYRARLGSNARARILGNFGIERAAREFADLYRSLAR